MIPFDLTHNPSALCIVLHAYSSLNVLSFGVICTSGVKRLVKRRLDAPQIFDSLTEPT